MKVVVHPADEGGCGSYRLTWPARACAAQGHDVRVDFDTTYQASWQPSVFGDRIVAMAQDVEADVVVLQRPLRRERVELIAALQTEGVAVVVEIDDDFHAIHPRNPAWRGSNPLADRDKNRDWLKKACARADLVTVTTPALAQRYGAHGRVAVVPNCVPERYLTQAPGAYTEKHLPKLSGVQIGWTGSVATHPDDLQATKGAVAGMMRASGARFHVVGTGLGVQDALDLDEPPTATGWLPIEAYPEAILQFDVGIVPLAEHPFNEAKSWLKGLEFAALGVPFVASSTGPYRELMREGVGTVALDPADWYGALSLLATDPVLREETALQGQERAARWTIEANTHRWLEAWEQAVENRSERAAA